MEKRTVLLGSIYTYNDAQDLLDHLDPAGSSQHMFCRFDNSKQQIKATFDSKDGEKVSAGLARALKEYSEADDHTQDYDDGDAAPTKVTLVSDSQTRAELMEIYANVDSIIEQEQKAAAHSSKQPLFIHENVQRSWEIGSDVGFVMYTKPLLGEIEEATGARVQLTGNTITVFADTAEVVDLVYQKLSNCEEAFASRSRGFLRFDFHADEKMSGHSFRFRYASRGVDNELNAISGFAARYYEVVMCRWSAASQSYPAVLLDSSPIFPLDRSCLWPFNFKFKFGEWSRTAKVLPDAQEVPFGVLEQLKAVNGRGSPDKIGQIKTWRQHLLPHQDSEDTVEETQKAELCNENHFPSDLQKPTPQHRDNRSLLGSLREELEEPYTDMPQLVGPGTLLLPKNPMSARQVHEPSLGSFPVLQPVNSGPVRAAQPNKPETSRSIKSTDSKLQDAQTPMHRPNIVPKGHHVQEAVASSLSSNVRPLNPGAPQTSPNPKPTIAKQRTHLGQSRGLCLQGPPKPKTQQHSRGSADQSVTEKPIIKRSDREIREYHFQGSHRAGPSKPSSKPFDLELEVWRSLLCILNTARLSGKTEPVVKLQIGKIFVEAASVPEQWHCHKSSPANAFSPGHWADIFHAHRARGSAQTLFTSRLTDFFAEAEHLVELNMPNNDALFVPPSRESELPLPELKTWVVIHCTDNRTGQDVIVEVDDQQNVSVSRPVYTTGSVNLHFPRRAWDARFLVEEATLKPVNFGISLVSMVENLWVGGPLTLEHLKNPIVASTKDASVEIRSVRFYQDTIYDVNSQAFAGLKVHITQILDLYVRSQSMSFAAYLMPEDRLRHDGRVWWEMDVRSPFLESQLRQASTGLGIGDKGNFGQSNRIEKCCRDMVNLAEQIVTQIDGVGLNTYFQHPKLSGSSSPYKRSRSTHPTQSHYTSRPSSRGQTRPSQVPNTDHRYF